MQDGLLRILDLLSQAVEIEFDPVLAHESVHSADREYPGTDAEQWQLRAIQAAKKLGLRLIPTDGPFGTIKKVIRRDRPAIAFLPARDGRPPRWLMIRDPSAGNDLEVDAITGDVRDLGRRGASRAVPRLYPGESPQWLVAERLLPCLEASSLSIISADHGHGRGGINHGSHGHGHRHLSPFQRLLGLIRTERQDIWLVVLYAIGAGALSLATPLAIEALVTTVALNQIPQQLVILSLLLLLCLALAAILKAMQTHLVEVLQRRVFARVASDLAYRLPRVKVDVYDSNYGPELVNRFFDILTVQKVGASLLLDGISVVLAAFFGLLILAFYHPFLLGFDVLLLLIMGLLVFVLGKGAIPNAINESRAKYALAGTLEEIARAPLTYKVDGAADLALRRADALTRRYLLFRQKHWSILFRQIVFALGIQALATSALLGLGGYLVINEALNLGQLVAAELIVATILAGFAKLGKHLESWYDLMAAMDKIGHLMDLPLERNDGEGRPDSEKNEPASLSIHQLTYGYDHHHFVLKNLDLFIAPGEKVALVGPSGSGKSTLVDLIYGLRTPNHGSIVLDDHNIRDLELECLRSQVAAVKGIEVLEESILENIRVGRGEISLRDVRSALDQVGLLDEIDQLPEGLATILGTTGSPLSLGQARRLMIARAIVGQPRLLIVDEGLDGLDFLTRRKVMRTLFHREAPWTLILVTHEQEVAQHCDRAVALAGGKTDRTLTMGNGHSPKIEDWLKEVESWRLN